MRTACAAVSAALETGCGQAASRPAAAAARRPPDLFRLRPDTRVPTPQGLGGEDLLLDEFAGLGLHCNPATQLVVTCEVCRRPATKECWTCRMQICEFCTLKRHWKVRSLSGSHPS